MPQQEPVRINPDAMKQIIKMCVAAQLRAMRAEQKKAQ